MSQVTIELSVDQLAAEMSRWSYDDLMELIKVVDELKGEWDFINHLKLWVDIEHRKMQQEELEIRAERRGMCLHEDGLSAHVDPHVRCILR